MFAEKKQMQQNIEVLFLNWKMQKQHKNECRILNCNLKLH